MHSYFQHIWACNKEFLEKVYSKELGLGVVCDNDTFQIPSLLNVLFSFPVDSREAALKKKIDLAPALAVQFLSACSKPSHLQLEPTAPILAAAAEFFK